MTAVAAACRACSWPKTWRSGARLCLEKDPADRPRSAAEVLGTLDSAEAISGPVAAPARARSKRRWNTWLTALAVSLVVAGFAALVLWSLWPTQARLASTSAASGNDEVVVRVTPAAAIGANSAELAVALTSTIETALVRAGARVVTGAASDAVSPAQSASFALQTTVQRSGDRGRAQVRLFRANPDSSLWAEQLDFTVADNFAAQDSVAARVVRAVRDAAARLRAP